MPSEVLVLGGTGNFGRRIVAGLARHSVDVIAAGRNRERAVEGVPLAVFDVRRELDARLDALRPRVVVNTCGPFQNSDYAIAKACIARRIHYIDLADSRDFVAGIATLDEAAKAQGVAAITGASTIPGLSSAVIEHFRHEFSQIESLDFGVAPGQKTQRGLATTKAIMTYVGKPLKPFAGRPHPVHGWQGVHRREYPEIGKRWMANCDIPDLDLLPARYGIASIRFFAGTELGVLHLGLWLLSWMVRAGLPLDLPRHASQLLKISNLFDAFGTKDGGMHVILRGNGHERRWFVIAKDAHGPQIPCVPAILLAKKLLSGEGLKSGAYACVGLITLDEYMRELSAFNIRQVTA